MFLVRTFLIRFIARRSRLNRLQNTVHVVIADHTTGKIRIAFTDHDDAWIDLQSAAWYGGEWATF